MRRGQTVTATQRAERSRAATRLSIARELMTAGIFARIWPAYLTTPKIQNDTFPLLLCVESPAGLLVWRLSVDERAFFEDWIRLRPSNGEAPSDRLPILQNLAANGWTR